MNNLELSVSGVAHDLNNQIMILLNSLDRIMVLCPDDADAILAMKAAEQCAGLTAQLLPRTRFPGPRRHAAVSVREIISETALLVRCLLPAHNRMDVDCRTDRHISAVVADFQQALVNLCLNAIDAMDGPGVIRLAAADELDAVTVSVSDTGPGVSTELREHIFEPLFTTKAGRGGCGLGLARARQTVEKLGGTISLHDVFPHGASFRIRIPSCDPPPSLSSGR